MFRKHSGLMLGVDSAAVDFHVEDPAPSCDQLGLNAFCIPNCIRQTGGFGQVVSLGAIGNPYLH